MIEIREEKISEQRETENVVREAFWNVYSPGCSDHYLVHQIRQCPAYIPQLNLVAVKNETIVGHVINIKSYISGDDGRNYEVISLGPISVLPQYQRTGVGSKLISEVKKNCENNQDIELSCCMVIRHFILSKVLSLLKNMVFVILKICLRQLFIYADCLTAP